MRRLCHEHLEDRSLLAVLTVDSLADSGTGSLRAAIDEANNTDGPHTIDFAEELAGETITLESGELHITDDLTIIGLGADQLTISGNNASRLFLVDDGNPETTITVSISGLSLVDGSTSGYGGAIRNLENLTVEDCVLANNSARYGGGGIFTFWYSTLTVTNSTLANNSANYGGGIFNHHQSTLTVTNSTLANNSATNYGGGIFNYNSTLTVTNSTLADNSADWYGGGIYTFDYSTLTVTNSTLADNSTDRYGGGIYNDAFSTLTVTNSLLGGNTAGSGPEIWKDATSTIAAAYNVIQDGAGSGINHGDDGNQVGTAANPLDPLLDPAGLQDNGGPTQTIALMPGSPAINAGDDALAVDADGNPLVFDQRGPGFDRFVGTVDIGAFEVQNQPPVAVDDYATTAEDVAVVIDVLANDWDPDGDPLTVIAVTDPTSGSAVINADYTITYTPAIDFNGVDSFMYTLSDGRGGTDTATVTVTVLSPTEQIDAMLANIQLLLDDGALNRGQANSLSVKLHQMQRRLDAGQTHVALNQLNAFTNHVTDLIAEGVLTEEEGQLLLDAAEDLRTSLTVTEDEAAVDVALADDDLLADVLPRAASASPAGRRR